MKVIVSGYVGKKVTGIGRSLINWLNRIQRPDIYFIVYTNSDMVNDLRFSNPHITVKTYHVSRENSIGNLLWTSFILPIMAIKERADVTLITNFTLLLFPVKPTVIFLHDMTEYKVPEKQSRLRVFYRTKLAIPISAKNATRVITVSQNSKKDIIEILGLKDSKISFVYNGIDREFFKRMNADEAKSIIKKRGWKLPFVAYVGTIDHPGRNLIRLIQAFEKLLQEGKFFGQLLLAGRPGKGYEKVEEYVSKSKYKDNIALTGYVSDKELIAMYSLCSAFCYLSLYEGFGMPPVEAMSCGAHVIVSNTSSLPEAVGNVGYKINPEDVDNIELTLEKAINAPYSSEYVKRVDNHLNKFSWDNEAAKLGDILVEVWKNKK